jgi:hypothetical protein
MIVQSFSPHRTNRLIHPNRPNAPILRRQSRQDLFDNLHHRWIEIWMIYRDLEPTSIAVTATTKFVAEMANWNWSLTAYKFFEENSITIHGASNCNK